MRACAFILKSPVSLSTTTHKRAAPREVWWSWLLGFRPITEVSALNVNLYFTSKRGQDPAPSLRELRKH